MAVLGSHLIVTSVIISNKEGVATGGSYVANYLQRRSDMLTVLIVRVNEDGQTDGLILHFADGSVLIL